MSDEDFQEQIKLLHEIVGVPPKYYANAIQRYCRSSDWFMMPSVYLLVMSIEESFMFQTLMNLGERVPRNSKRLALWEKGWIPCTVKLLEKRTKLKRGTQSRILKRLKNKGFISIELVGIPPMRYIKVDLNAVDYAIDEVDRNGGGE